MIARSAERTTTRENRALERAPKDSSSNTVLWLSVAGGVLFLLGVGLMLSRKSSTEDAAKSEPVQIAQPDSKPTAKVIPPPAPTAPPKLTPPIVSAAPAKPVEQNTQKTEPPQERKLGGLLGSLNNTDKQNGDDWHEKYARHLLDDAKEYAKQNPQDIWRYRELLNKLTLNYSSSAAAKEAGPLMAELKPPDGSWPDGHLIREIWNNIGGANVQDLVKHPSFSGPPKSTEDLSSLAGHTSIGDNFGSRIRGYLIAPLDGDYTFWIASDDEGELWLSTDDNPANKQKIAHTGWVDENQWDKFPCQKSSAVSMQHGKKYYFEVLHKEGGGNDHISVGWQLPNKVMERPIPGSRLSSFK